MKNEQDKRAVEMAAHITESLPKLWAEEIERAIDKLKRPKRTAVGKWFRKELYRAKWRMRNLKGPRITRD